MHKLMMGCPRNSIISSSHRSISLNLSLLIILALHFHHPAIAAADPPSIYENLRRYGLPTGLLPKGITKFSINPTTGDFQAFLDQPCNAKFENRVHYDFNVTGRLSSGKIGELSGVSSQELFLWFPVKGIRVDFPSSGLIHFDVGVVDKQFSLSLFEFPPDCAADEPVEHEAESDIKLQKQNSDRTQEAVS